MSHKFVLGLVGVLLVQASIVAAQGLNDEQLAVLSKNLFNRADADKNGQLNDREPAQAQALVVAQIELVARRALADPRLRIEQVLGEAALPAMPQSDNLSEAEFRQHVGAMFLAADRPVRALYEQKLDRLFQLQAEMRRRNELRDGVGPFQDGRNLNDGRFGDGREFPRGREGERFGQDGPRNREQKRRGENMEQQRREAAARAAAAERERQLRAEQQRREQQAKPQPFGNRLQPKQNAPNRFGDKIRGK